MFSFFFFKQKTAYEMRISDWSSDVCSSDLSQQARDAGDEILVEWDNCGERLARRRRAEPQPMLARSVGDDDMASVDSSHGGKQRAQRARIDRDGRLKRSESRRVGQEWGSTGRYRGWTYHYKNTKNLKTDT